MYSHRLCMQRNSRRALNFHVWGNKIKNNFCQSTGGDARGERPPGRRKKREYCSLTHTHPLINGLRRQQKFQSTVELFGPLQVFRPSFRYINNFSLRNGTINKRRLSSIVLACVCMPATSRRVLESRLGFHRKKPFALHQHIRRTWWLLEEIVCLEWGATSTLPHTNKNFFYLLDHQTSTKVSIMLSLGSFGHRVKTHC